MKNNIENGIYIPDENRELHPLDEWMKREDPTTAQTVVLVTDSGMLEIAKEDLPGEFNFEVAQKAAAEYREGFRCATPTGRAMPTPIRSTIPTARSSTTATRATCTTTTASIARAPCVRFPLSRNSFRARY